MYPTRWVFFKPLPICFSPSSPLSKLPTKTTNVGSKLASLKSQRPWIWDLTKFSKDHKDFMVGWHMLHWLHLIVSDRTFSPLQTKEIVETNEWIHRQPSPALFSTTDHPYLHPSLKNCSREILRVFATWRTSSSPSSSPSTWSFIF